VEHKEVCGQMAVLCDCRTCSRVRIFNLSNTIQNKNSFAAVLGKINSSPKMKQKVLHCLVATAYLPHGLDHQFEPFPGLTILFVSSATDRYGPHVRWHQGSSMPNKNIRGIFAKTVTPHVSFWLIEDQISSWIKVVGLLYHVLLFYLFRQPLIGMARM
jgi:hypothetical protein